MMGADVPDAEIEAILSALGFAPVRADATQGSAESLLAAWTCRRPSWRGDITREIDLIEEVARLYGVDKFPPRLPAAKLPAARLEYAEAEDRLRERLIGLGYQEIITIPIVDEASDALFRAENAAPARIANPLAEDASVMRSTGAVTMVATLEWNLNHGQRNVRLFEFGKTYRWNGSEPVETRVLTLGATGLAREKGVAETERAFVFADLKGDLDQIGHLAGGFLWKAGAPEWLHPAHAGMILAASRRCDRTPDRSCRTTLAARLRTVQAAAGRLRRGIGTRLRSARVTGRRARRCATNRFRVSLRSSVIFLSFSPTEQRSPPWWRRFAPSGIAEVSSIDAVDLFRGKNVPAGKFSLLGARDVREPPGHAHRSAVDRFFFAHPCRARTKARRLASRLGTSL